MNIEVKHSLAMAAVHAFSAVIWSIRLTAPYRNGLDIIAAVTAAAVAALWWRACAKKRQEENNHE